MYLQEQNLAWVAKGEEPIYLVPKMANRHGLIAGATGTGKTVTVKVLAESFSEMGTPVFLADVKGDVSGMIVSGDKPGITKFLNKCGVPEESFDCKPFPTRFWDVYGDMGHSIRTTVSAFGPDLLARLLELTDVQAGVLTIVFKVADDNGWLLIDLKDLKAMVKYVSENAKTIRDTYGNVSPQTIGTIQRNLLKLEEAGGNIFFGEPELDIFDWMQLDTYGKGYINILECAKLVQSPLLYSTFLLWMLSEIYERLPEAGDLERPKMVFFFDEAHLLFDDAPKALVSKVEQVVRLIRSKGVGVYFISQKPADVPENVLAQLGNRIQHALRAYTPQEQKAIRVAAQSFRENPKFNTEEIITQLGTGEALVSLLDADGIPTIVDRARILPPQSSMKIADELLVKQNIAASPFNAKYASAVDRQSAYEVLNGINVGLSQGQDPSQVQVAQAPAQPLTADTAQQAAYAQAAQTMSNSGQYAAAPIAQQTQAAQPQQYQAQPYQAPVQQNTQQTSNVNILTDEQLEREKQKAIEEALKQHQKEHEAEEKARLKEEKAKEAERVKAEKAAEKEREKLERALEKEREKKSSRKSSSSSSYLGKAASTATTTIGREIGKSISRGILGGIKNLF